MIIDNDSSVAAIGQQLRARGWRLVTCESCSGGWLGKRLTDMPGSSSWYEGGLVTYSNALKQHLAGVDSKTLQQHGAVSEAVARELVAGGCRLAACEVGISITGIAGPDGGTDEKPVGTVCLAWQLPSTGKLSALYSVTKHFTGSREQVRAQAVTTALEGLLELLQQSNCGDPAG